MFSAQLAERRRLPAAALVEEDDAPERRVEEAPVDRRDPGAGPAVEEDDGPPAGVPDFLDVQLVEVGDAEPEGAVRLDLGKERPDVLMMSEDPGLLAQAASLSSDRPAGARD